MPLRHEPPTMPLNQSGSLRDRTGVNDDEPAAAREKVVQVPAIRRISMFPASCLWRMRTSVSSS